jgi:hypothetical protein
MSVERLNSTLERINGRLTTWGKYAQHRRDSRGRGIAFELTFDQWLKIWGRKLAKRGPLKGQYVMARFGDKGPYAVGNVQIITSEQNHHDANIGVPRPKTEQHKKRLSEVKTGLKRVYRVDGSWTMERPARHG